MKNNKKRRKFVVPLSDDEGADHPLHSAQPQRTVRITSHGKINAYVNHINSTLIENPSDQISVFAEGSAVCKLATVLEIIKREGHSGLTTTLTIGDAANHPHKHPPDATREPDDDDQPNKHVRGMYGSKIKNLTTASKERNEPIAPPDDKRSNDVWMQATLGFSS
ncbi:hypothetical protein H4R24_002908 [Coemansia sp. RSA 988]|nr:hypothetical protein H4R24_002908 [Coemansia sp. RSA 988]